MRTYGINGEGELWGQLANPGSHGKMVTITRRVNVRPQKPFQATDNLINIVVWSWMQNSYN